MAVPEKLLTVACGKCGHLSEVLEAFAGKQGRCPRCREVVVVPDAATAAAQAEERAAAQQKARDDEAAAAAVASAFDVATPQPEAAPPSGDHRPCRACGKPIRVAAIKCRHCGDQPDRPCPTCGESIKATAKKCRFCGEFLDASLRERARGEPGAHDLASPGARLAAWLADSALAVPAYGVGGMALYFDDVNQPFEFALCVLLASTWFVVLTWLQWSLTARTGQTLGKRWLGIMLQRIDGTPVDFVHGVILRNWIVNALGFPLIVFLWPITAMVWAVDGIMVFAHDRRTLRDYLASTRVIVKP